MCNSRIIRAGPTLYLYKEFTSEVYGMTKQRATAVEQDRRDASQAAGAVQMADTQAKIFKIWDGLNIDAHTRVATLRQLLQTASYSEDLQQQLEHIRGKYEAQVPIMKMINDREIILQRLKNIMQQQRSANQDLNQDPGGQDDNTRDQLLLELKDVSAALVDKLHRYEQRFAPEQFKYNGIWYVQAVEKHLKSMPELAFAKRATPRTAPVIT